MSYINQQPQIGFQAMPQPGGYPPAGPPGGPGYPPAGGYQPHPGYPPPSQPSYPQPNATGYPQPVVTGYIPPAQQQAMQMQPLMQGADPNVPLGLEYLTTLDKLIVKQKAHLVEAIVGFESANKYTVKAANGNKVFYAMEETDCCTRNCCGPARPFDMKVIDMQQRPVIHMYRPLRCTSCWCPCFLQTLEVCSPPGNLVGYVKQDWSICGPSFRIENAAGDTVLRIKGPTCTFAICGDVVFKVMSRDGEVEVGKISKKWNYNSMSGMVREMFTDADNFGISFPMDLDVKMKAVMLGACFLIDFMFFEKAGNKEEDRPGML